MDATYSLLSALKGQQHQMDTVANNLANVSTPGYKQDQALFEEYYNKMIGQDLESEEEMFAHGEFKSPLDRGTSSYVLLDHVSPSMRRGDYQISDNPYDLALETDGFFVVNTKHGLRYTRNGTFMRDVNGMLVTGTGDHVMGKKGSINITGTQFVVGNEGRIMVDNKEVDQLRIVHFEQPSRLSKMGNSNWAPGSKAQKPIESDNAFIRQGMIEGSNVDAVQELVEMITVNRSYEAAQRAMRSHDGLDEKVISISKV